MDYSSKQAAIESVREAVARGRAVIEVDGEVVWLHPDKVHSVNSVYASDEQGVIALYAILVGQTMGYDWAFESHGLRKPDPDQPQRTGSSRSGPGGALTKPTSSWVPEQASMIDDLSADPGLLE